MKSSFLLVKFTSILMIVISSNTLSHCDSAASSLLGKCFDKIFPRPCYSLSSVTSTPPILYISLPYEHLLYLLSIVYQPTNLLLLFFYLFLLLCSYLSSLNHIDDNFSCFAVCSILILCLFL